MWIVWGFTHWASEQVKNSCLPSMETFLPQTTSWVFISPASNENLIQTDSLLSCQLLYQTIYMYIVHVTAEKKFQTGINTFVM